jgi:uncharacterized Zn-binding protein involved in type VI secretion
MKIVGWIRQGDKAACGGVVIEGDATSISDGRPYAFQGARLDCNRSCTIADAEASSTLGNGRHQVIHGMTTSGGCPLYSTLNGIDGVADLGGRDTALRFVQDDKGEWLGKTNEGYDHHFVLVDDHTGEPLPNRHYRMTCNAKIVEGKSDANGKTEKITADDPLEVRIEIMPEGYLGTDK